MKLRNILYLLLMLPLICSCNNEDDVNEIFISGTWNVGNFYHGGDWSKMNDGARPKYTKEEEIKALNALTVVFEEEGVVHGQMGNISYTGHWDANGKDRTIRISNLKTSATPNGKAKELIDALRNATFYKGDTKYLKLANEERKSYVQLGHYSK